MSRFLLMLATSCLAGGAEPTLEQRLETMRAQLAADPRNHEIRYQTGVLLNEKAVNGDEAALDQAIALFEEMIQDNPDDHRAAAFLGSCYVLKARDASVFTKMRWCRQGFTLLDESVKQAPENPDVRLIRAINASQVPGFLGRGRIADDDFAWLLNLARGDALDHNPALRRAIFYHAGKHALSQRDAGAVPLLLSAQSTPGDPHLDPAIHQALEDARLRFPQEFHNTENS